MLLRRTYESFVRSGALLEGDDRETYSWLSSRLSELTTLFGQNVLKELNTYEIGSLPMTFPDSPKAPSKPQLLPPRRKAARGISLHSRTARLHGFHEIQ